MSIISYRSIFVKQSRELNRLFVCTIVETEHRLLNTVTMMATKVSIRRLRFWQQGKKHDIHKSFFNFQ